MTTSPITSLLSKPRGKDDAARIPEWMLDYVRERGKQDIHSLILGEFRRAGITQTTLAARLGHKMADRVCRYLRSPANWTIETVAELLFAICGKLIGFRAIDPLREHVLATTTNAQPTVIIVNFPTGATTSPTGATTSPISRIGPANDQFKLGGIVGHA